VFPRTYTPSPGITSDALDGASDPAVVLDDAHRETDGRLVGVDRDAVDVRDLDQLVVVLPEVLRVAHEASDLREEDGLVIGVLLALALDAEGRADLVEQLRDAGPVGVRGVGDQLDADAVDVGLQVLTLDGVDPGGLLELVVELGVVADARLLVDLHDHAGHVALERLAVDRLDAGGRLDRPEEGVVADRGRGLGLELGNLLTDAAGCLL